MTGAAGDIRYLGARSVRAAMPPSLELVDLAEVALRSLVAGGEVPEKAGLAPGPAGVFAHAMPARLTAAAVPGGGAPADLLGMKWIAGGPANRAAGLPALAALVVLNDPGTGLPLAILDGDVITAARTAALSGVAVRLLGPRPDRPARPGGPRTPTAVLVGAGRQGRAHAEMLGALLPGVELVIHDRHPERAEALAREAEVLDGVRVARPVDDPWPSLAGTDIVVSATSLASTRPELGPGQLAQDALVIPVDYGAWVTPGLVAAAAAFVVDDRATFEANRRAGRLAGWPDPAITLGELLLGEADGSRERSGGLPGWSGGLKVALHQGPGIADVIVADAVLRRAVELGVGVQLQR